MHLRGKEGSQNKADWTLGGGIRHLRASSSKGDTNFTVRANFALRSWERFRQTRSGSFTYSKENDDWAHRNVLIGSVSWGFALKMIELFAGGFFVVKADTWLEDKDPRDDLTDDESDSELDI